MADIQLTCTACGRMQTVVIFDADLGVSCPACGQVMSLIGRKPGLVLKRRDPPCPLVPAASEQALGSAVLPDLVARRSAQNARDSHAVQASALRVWLNTLVFLALAGFLAYYRFCGGWPGMPLEALKLYGLLAIAAAYLFIIGLALRDNMFDGLLAIVVPLYPFYYLFFASSALFARALVGALLVVFGYDSLLYLQTWAIGWGDAVKLWIQHK